MPPDRPPTAPPRAYPIVVDAGVTPAGLAYAIRATEPEGTTHVASCEDAARAWLEPGIKLVVRR
ncbi:MAG: hypothetical protein AB1689_09455 [Thermodesulfobacteriota bacterium]